MKNKFDLIIAILICLVVGYIVYYFKTSYQPNSTHSSKVKVKIINEKIVEYENEINRLKNINDSLSLIVKKRDDNILIVKKSRNNPKIDSIKTDLELEFAIIYLKNIK